jgi:plastocyanin
MRAATPLGGAALALALTLAACGGNTSTSPTTGARGSTTTPVAPTASTSGLGSPATGAGTPYGIPATTQLTTGRPAAGTTVTVTETEYKLTFSSTSFHPGPYTFLAVNRGKIIHALAISGPGVQKSTGTLQPGQSARLTVTLQAGRYDLYCPVPGHKGLGMNQEITVTG